METQSAGTSLRAPRLPEVKIVVVATEPLLK